MKVKNKIRRIGALLVSVAMLCTVMATPLSVQAQGDNTPPSAPSGLLTNELENPLNVEGAPRFSWLPQDADVDEVQTAYQLVITDAVDGSVVWDSGKVENTSEQSNVAYAGPALAAAHPYTWTVSTWDGDGVKSAPSEPASFSTGLSDEDWDAQWIQNPSSTPLSVVKPGAAARVEGGGFTLYSGGSEWTDYEITVDARAVEGAAGVAFRADNAGNAYVWSLEPGRGLVKSVFQNGVSTELGSVPLEIHQGARYTLYIVVSGDQITTSVDGLQVDECDNQTLGSGTVGFYEEAGQIGEFAGLSVDAVVEKVRWAKVNGSSSTPIVLNELGYDWENYTLDFDVRIGATAAAVMLRSKDFNNGYMWQFSQSKKGLARHIMKGGKFTKIDGDGSVSYPFAAGQTYHVTIAVNGSTITTSVNGTLLDTYTDSSSTYTKGTFGFREASGESGSFANLKITTPDGTSLLDETFANLSHYRTPSGPATTISVSEEAAGGEQASLYKTDFSGDLSAWNSEAMRKTDGALWVRDSKGGVTVAKTGSDWEDYTLTMRMKVESGAAGIVFRAPDSQNGYMWQIVDGSGLKVHKQVDGKFTALKNAIPYTITTGETYRLTIEVNGSTFKTYINGELIDTTEDATFASGTVGFRESTTSTEIGQFSELLVLDSTGNQLLRDDFDNGVEGWSYESGAATGSNMYWYARTENKLEEGKKPVRALAYVACAHDYELSINGTRIGRGQSFDYSSETRYQGWDVTEALGGSDSIAVGILARWYGNGQGRAAGVQGLIGHVVVYYEDGSSQVIATDGNWVTATTPFSGTAKRNGEGDFIEYYDAQLERSGWSDLGYDVTDWTPVYVHGDHPTKTFSHLTAELGHVTEEPVSPVSVTVLEDGTTVADFGRVIPARLSVNFENGKAGRQLNIVTGYELKDNGRVNTSSSSSQGTKMNFYYTQKDGAQRYDSWDHLGFRYLEIPAADETFSAEDITARILHAEVPEGRDSTFTSSNEMLDKVYQLMKDSALYSLQNEFVDTPTREKGQFLQDGVNVSAATTTTWFERESSRKAILQFLASADRYWNSGGDLGRYNAVYPNGDGKRDIPDYSLNMPTWVWRYYEQTGDRELLELAYPYLQKTADYASNAIPSDGATAGLVTELPGGSGQYKYGIVDWPEPGRFGYDMSATARTTVNALSVRTFDTVAQIAKELGKDEAEIKDYTDRAQALRTAMNQSLITSNGVYADGLLADGTQSSHEGQHSTSYALAFGIAPEEQIAAMADYIASLGMKQGPMTAEILVQALFDTGRADAAVKLLTNTDDLGWAKLVDDGYTFIWEQWTYGQSQSHGWGAAAAPEILENLLGVTLTGVGASSISIDPARDVLEHAQGRVVTERGPVEVAYSGSGTEYTLKISVPVNVEATVVLPRIAGGEFVDKNGNSGTSTFTEDEQIVSVGSGTREFVFQAAGTDKTILERVIAYAENAKTGAEYQNVIPSVKDSFDAALLHAQQVCGNPGSLQEEIDSAWISLMTEIHKLGFQKGSKVQLQLVYDEALAINLDNYVPAGQKEFTDARDAAFAVLNDGDAMQGEISEATLSLLEAMYKLRFKADKSILETVLADAAELDVSGYTAQSAAVFKAASEAAKVVYDDPNATQEQVNEVTKGLQEAMDGLRTVSGTAAETGIEGAVAGDTTLRAGNGSAKTGERVPFAAAAVLLALAGASLVMSRKKR